MPQFFHDTEFKSPIEYMRSHPSADRAHLNAYREELSTKTTEELRDLAITSKVAITNLESYISVSYSMLSTLFSSAALLASMFAILFSLFDLIGNYAPIATKILGVFFIVICLFSASLSIASVRRFSQSRSRLHQKQEYTAFLAIIKELLAQREATQSQFQSVPHIEAKIITPDPETAQLLVGGATALIPLLLRLNRTIKKNRRA